MNIMDSIKQDFLAGRKKKDAKEKLPELIKETTDLLLAIQAPHIFVKRNEDKTYTMSSCADTPAHMLEVYTIALGHYAIGLKNAGCNNDEVRALINETLDKVLSKFDEEPAEVMNFYGFKHPR